MKTNKKPMGALIRFPFLDDWLTYSTDQLEEMTPAQLAELRNLPVSPNNPLQYAPAKTKTTYPKTSRRRRKTFADGSQLIESANGYEIFEGIPQPKKAKRKARPGK